MNLTKYEQEVVINFNASDASASVYTANPVWIRKMDRLLNEFPELVKLNECTSVSRTYVLPKKLIRVGRPRISSPRLQD